MDGELRILCVCSHNRTRSVITEALLGLHLRESGVPALVRSVGIRADGAPPTEPTIERLARRGVDVSGHRSRLVNDASMRDADLIVTAEREHVVHIVGRTPELFAKTFRLPELVERAEAVGGRAGRPVAEWLERLGGGRPVALDYLQASDDAANREIEDPTGRLPRVWDDAVARIDDLTGRLAGLLR